MRGPWASGGQISWYTALSASSMVSAVLGFVTAGPLDGITNPRANSSPMAQPTDQCLYTTKLASGVNMLVWLILQWIFMLIVNKFRLSSWPSQPAESFEMSQ